MKIKKYIWTILGVLAGNVILAFAVAAFILPHGMVMGGATGIALTLHHFLNIELSALIFILNAVLFLLGALVLGKKFALTTIISSVTYPIILKILQTFDGIQHLTEDMFLATIYGGLLLGLGIGIVIRMGASSGGTDILALVLNKKLHISVAVCLYVLDFAILCSQAIFSTGEQILYGILILFVTTLVLNRVSLFGKSQIQLFIISAQYESIRRKLLEEMDVGATMIHMESGYEKKQQQGVLCVISNRKLYAVREVIMETDPEAFITVSQINEVRGRGFSLDRRVHD